MHSPMAVFSAGWRREARTSPTMLSTSAGRKVRGKSRKEPTPKINAVMGRPSRSFGAGGCEKSALPHTWQKLAPSGNAAPQWGQFI
jgi:hypothetical protein